MATARTSFARRMSLRPRACGDAPGGSSDRQTTPSSSSSSSTALHRRIRFSRITHHPWGPTRTAHRRALANSPSRAGSGQANQIRQMSLEFRGKPAGRCSQARTDLVCFAAKPTPHLKERQSPLPARPPNPCYWGAKQTCIIFGAFPGRKSKMGFLSTRLLGVPFGPQGAMPDPAPHIGVPGTK